LVMSGKDGSGQVVEGAVIR